LHIAQFASSAQRESCWKFSEFAEGV